MSSNGGYRVILDSMDASAIAGNIMREQKSTIITELFPKRRGPVDKASITGYIAGMNAHFKKKIIKRMQNKFGFSYPNSKYISVLAEVEGYDYKPINVSKTLDNSKITEFNVDFPYNSNYTFVSTQLIKAEFQPPQLVNPSAVPQGYAVRYRYCKLPGIRLLKEIKALSDIAEFDGYKQEDALKYNNDCITDNIYEVWNKLMGQDLGNEAQQYNVFTQATEVHKMMVGYQTGKEVQEGLKLYIPLLLNHNRNLNDKINLSAFNKDVLSFKGQFERSDLIVQAAAFNLSDPDADPIPLAVRPLEFKSCGLYSLFTSLDDVMFALNMGVFYERLYNYVKHRSYTINESELEVKLGANEGEALQMAVCVRPKSYSKDFDLWTQFSTVKSTCYPVPYTYFNTLTSTWQVGVGGAKVLEPVDILEHINLDYNGTNMMVDGTERGDGDPNIWKLVDVYSKSLRYLNYHVRDTGLVYFNFNPHVNTRKIGCVYNFTKLQNSILRLKLNTSAGVNSNRSLINPYEVLVYYDIINSHIISGGTMAKVMITS